MSHWEARHAFCAENARSNTISDSNILHKFSGFDATSGNVNVAANTLQ